MANLTIDRGTLNVVHGGGKLEVDEIEFEILWAVVNKPGRAFTADDLIHILSPFELSNQQIIKAAMESLAAKLGPLVYFDQSSRFQFRRA